MTGARFEIVQTDAPQPFHVRLIADNGEPISDGENHPHLGDARNAIEAEADLFGYDVVEWLPEVLCLTHRLSGTPLHVPVVRVDERRVRS